MQAAAAIDCSVVEAPLCCDVAATDLKDATNSQGMGNNTLTSAFSDEVSNAKGHGEATSVQGSTGSTAFSLMHHSLIRGCRPDSLHHPIHACAHSRLDLCGVGSGVGVGFGACAGVSCGVSSGVVDDVDDAWMVDEICVVSNSVIQTFTEYHGWFKCSFERSAEFTCGTWSSSPGRNKGFKYGFLVQGQAVRWATAVKKSAWRDVGRSS